MRQSHPLFFAGLFSLGLLACGKAPDPNAGPGKEPNVSEQPAATAAQPTGQVHKVAMRGTAEGYFFEPKHLTLERGETVEWTMVDGGPHNASFMAEPDSLPSGAQAILEQQGKMTGPLLGAPGQTYSITFGDEMPTGTYHYKCDPHAVLGMTGTLTLTE